ncbi:hypothetical protein BDW72DRAFT_180170 [Aspergillus terricola var. indicus]
MSIPHSLSICPGSQPRCLLDTKYSRRSIFRSQCTPAHVYLPVSACITIHTCSCGPCGKSTRLGSSLVAILDPGLEVRLPSAEF